MNQEKFISGLEQEFVAKMDDEMVKDLIIMGDFNVDVIALKPCEYTRKLMQTTRLLGLCQLVNKPTRVTEFTSTAIDLVFVNNTHSIISHGVQKFGASDHSVTFIVKKARVCKSHVEIRYVRSFKHYNKEHFQRVIREVKHDVYGKRQTAKMKPLPSLISCVYSRVKLFVFAMDSRRGYSIFVCLSFINGLEEKNSKLEVTFAVCRLPLTSCLTSLLKRSLECYRVF